MKIHRTSIWDYREGEVFLHHSAKTIVPLDKVCNRIVYTFTLTREPETVRIAIFPHVQPEAVVLIPFFSPKWVEEAIHAGFDSSGKLKDEFK